jgi:hypothetical protein
MHVRSRAAEVVSIVDAELAKLKSDTARSDDPDLQLTAYLRYALGLSASLTRFDLPSSQRAEVHEAALCLLLPLCRDAVAEPLKARVRLHGSVELAELAEEFDRRLAEMRAVAAKKAKPPRPAKHRARGADLS